VCVYVCVCVCVCVYNRYQKFTYLMVHHQILPVI